MKLWLVSSLGSSPDEIQNWPHPQRTGETEERGDHSRLAGGSSNKHRDLHTMLVLVAQDEELSVTAAKILRVWTQALTVFSHTFSFDSLNSLFSQCCTLENSSVAGAKGRIFQGQRREKPLTAQVQLTSQAAIMSSP